MQHNTTQYNVNIFKVHKFSIKVSSVNRTYAINTTNKIN